jgi:hypothetical protein
MSLSGLKALSFLVTKAGTANQAVYVYTSAEAAQADYAQQDSNSSPCFLYLETMPTKSLVNSKVTGTFVDAYGVNRNLPGLGVVS